MARDSAQVAERVPQPDCNTATPVTPSVRHCGGVSVWDVASGGRMGFVTGEDAVEVANPPTDCVQDCQAQNQVRGRLAVLGLPVPGARRQPTRPARLGTAPAAGLTAPTRSSCAIRRATSQLRPRNGKHLSAHRSRSLDPHHPVRNHRSRVSRK